MHLCSNELVVELTYLRFHNRSKVVVWHTQRVIDE